jgi:hypothetical protein
MRRILGGHAAWLNTHHGRSGAVFGERFWSTRVDGDAQLVRACLYTFLNPVVAGVVRHPQDWPWSSYMTLVEDGCSPRLTAILGDSPEDARTHLLELVDEAVEALRETRENDRVASLRIAGALAARTAKGRG